MCNPVAIGGIAIGLQAFGMLNSMDAQAQAAEAQAAQARKNRDNAKIMAAEAVNTADYEATRIQMRADQMVSKIRTAATGGNVDISGGAPARMASDTRILSQLDMDMARLRGAQKAAGFILQGDTFNAQAAIADAQRSAILTGGTMSLVGDALSGAARLYDRSKPFAENPASVYSGPMSLNQPEYQWQPPDFGADISSWTGPGNYVTGTGG